MRAFQPQAAAGTPTARASLGGDTSLAYPENRSRGDLLLAQADATAATLAKKARDGVLQRRPSGADLVQLSYRARKGNETVAQAEAAKEARLAAEAKAAEEAKAASEAQAVAESKAAEEARLREQLHEQRQHNDRLLFRAQVESEGRALLTAAASGSSSSAPWGPGQGSPGGGALHAGGRRRRGRSIH